MASALPFLGVVAVNPVAASAELEEVVLRARRRAETTGELGPRHRAHAGSAVPPEVREVLRDILRNGSYAEAVARIGELDRGVADQ